ncbi:MAG: hypothetical protein IPM71_02840 [Bacteroidota bacterium]|nr:MAG: hypothetical protein IPM71_02840 [Bacteroidota bacterium]
MKFSFGVFFMFILCLRTISQEIITETIFIEVKPDSLIPFNLNIEKISCLSSQGCQAVGYSHRKKFLIVPVDQEIATLLPINLWLAKNLSSTQHPVDTYRLEINYFTIKKKDFRFSSFYALEADIFVYKNQVSIGTLSYNYPYSPASKKIPVPEVHEQLINTWQQAIKIDLLTSSTFFRDSLAKPPEVYLPLQFSKPEFLNLGLAFVAGIDFWQVDGELYFTRPETTKINLYRAGLIRYQYTQEFEIISFGKRSEHLFLRISPLWAVDISSNLLIGINKWHNAEDIKLEQVFQLSASSSQTMAFGKVNQPGLTFRLGLFENLYYIPYMALKLQLGVYLSTGYKF